MATEGQGGGQEGRGFLPGGDDGANKAEKEGDSGVTSAIKLARASVLCTSAQGDLILGRDATTASERLGEALRIREELLPGGHPATVRD